MSDATTTQIAVIGGGPAGLMAAETARAAGARVDLYDAMGSVGRKFLLAGKGGLNLTHSEPFARFVERYGDRRNEIADWLRQFDADNLRAWARGLGVETKVGTSGRVFPADLKAAPLLRGWVRRLRESGVVFHMHHRCLGWNDAGALRFDTAQGPTTVRAAAVVLAMGGGSWAKLGSDGAWVAWLGERGVDLAPLQPSNCGFDTDWSAHFAAKHAGHAIKPVVASWIDRAGTRCRLQGELMATATGLEGGLIYALSADLREMIAAQGSATLSLDLAPDHQLEQLTQQLAQPGKGRSLSEVLRRRAGLSPVKVGLVYEYMAKAAMNNAGELAAAIKSLPVVLKRTRPIDEAISTAGGVRFGALDEHLMLRAMPGVFCAGEMLDWEAPTGGYLLTACWASGRIAGASAACWPANSKIS